MSKTRTRIALAGLLALAAAGPATRPTSQPAVPTTGKAVPPGKVDFVKQVKPLLEATCAKCHGRRPTKAYQLMTKKQAFTPGESEELPIVPSHADQSLIVQLMKGNDPEHRMPQKAPAMKPEQIALIEKWINEGATWPDGVDLVPPPEEPEK